MSPRRPAAAESYRGFDASLGQPPPNPGRFIEVGPKIAPEGSSHTPCGPIFLEEIHHGAISKRPGLRPNPRPSPVTWGLPKSFSIAIQNCSASPRPIAFARRRTQPSPSVTKKRPAGTFEMIQVST